MRLLLLLTILGTFALTPLSPAKAQQPAVEQIKEMMTAQATAWNNGDLEAFMQPYWRSDSLLFIGKPGITYGWQATLDRYRKTYPGKDAMGKLTFKFLEFNLVADNIYFVVGKWQLQRSIGDLQGHFSLIIRKIGNDWKIVADHSS